MVTIKRKPRNAAFRAIADPTRREILGLLRGGPQSVGKIASHFRSSRPAISKHLRVLRTAGLVATHKDGAAHICRLNAEPLQAVNAWVQEYEAFWSGSLRGLKNYVEAADTAQRDENRRRE
jgi:DNA-binding transcriptional ArsR family regulator